LNNRIWTLAAAIVCIAIVALGLVVGILPKLAESAAADLSRVSIDAQNAIYEGELVRLQKEFEGLDDIVAELEELQQSLPAGHDEAAWLRQVSAAAASTGVLVSDYTQDVPVLYGNFDAAGNAAEGQQPISGGTLLGIPISLKVESYDLHALYAILRPLQQGQRLFMVSSMSLESDEGGDAGYYYKLTIKGYIYTLADPAAATVDTPAPTDTPTPTETETSVPEETNTPAPTETSTP
jgi:hypothetical protein